MSGPRDHVHDPARLAALRERHLLDTPAEDAFDQITAKAAGLLQAPVAMVSLVDDQRQFLKSITGTLEPWGTLRETPLSHSICRHVVDSAGPLVIGNLETHQLIHDEPQLRDLKIAAYAGVPIRTPEGAVLGSLCVIDRSPRAWSPEQVATLERLASSVGEAIESHARATAGAATTGPVPASGGGGPSDAPSADEALALLDALWADCDAYLAGLDRYNRIVAQQSARPGAAAAAAEAPDLDTAHERLREGERRLHLQATTLTGRLPSSTGRPFGDEERNGQLRAARAFWHSVLLYLDGRRRCDEAMQRFLRQEVPLEHVNGECDPVNFARTQMREEASRYRHCRHLRPVTHP